MTPTQPTATTTEAELAETIHGEIVRVVKRDNPLKEPIAKCSRCNDTGMIAIRSRDGAYAFPGPVPDDAKGYADADCWHCDSGRRGGFDGPTGAE